MAAPGKFGKRYAKIDLQFEFLDETFRANPSASKAAIIEFLAVAADVDINDEVKGAKVIMQLLREVVHPDDFDRFWALAKAERQDPATDLMPIANWVLEQVTGFPTGPSADLSAGPTPTPVKSAAGSSSPTSADKALAMLRGRPDLQQFVVLEEEANRHKALTN